MENTTFFLCITKEMTTLNNTYVKQSVQNQVEQQRLSSARWTGDADYERRTIFDVITEKYLFPFFWFEIAVLFRKEIAGIHFI